MWQLDGSSECDSGCVVSYCQFSNSSRFVVQSIGVILERDGGEEEGGWGGEARERAEGSRKRDSVRAA